MKGKNLHITVLLITLLMLIGCEDFLQVETPKDRLPSAVIYESDATALSALSGLYSKWNDQANGFANGGLSSFLLAAGVSSDELDNYTASGSLKEFYDNQILPANLLNKDLWNSAYSIIYTANAIIKGVSNSVYLSPDVASRVKGEALFIRAFCHFYLLNMFGAVPLVNTTDYRVNKVAKRTSIESIYTSIISDLEDARVLLSNEYPSAGKVRVNKLAVSALLARIYVYTEDWVNAEIQSSIVISSGIYDLNENLNDVFQANSTEAILQLLNTRWPKSTNEGNIFILTTSPGIVTPVAITDTLFNSFEPNDARKISWVGTYTSGANTFHFPWKYKNRHAGTQTVTEYSMVLRLAEQYLIRAEARAHLAGKFSLALADLNEIRDRAELSILTETEIVNEDDLIAAIMQERKVEYFAEWGHRWLDLKRTGKIDAVLSGIKPSWQTTDKLYPLPESEMVLNPNLRPQNDGY